MLMIRMRWAFALLLGLMLAANAGSVAAAAPSLAATPVEDVVTGTSTITWDTGDGSVGQVYVAVIEDREGRAGGITGDRLFVTAPSGSQDAPWIAYSSAYRFSLYAGLTHTTLLRSFVFRVTFSQRLTATPTQCPQVQGWARRGSRSERPPVASGVAHRCLSRWTGGNRRSLLPDQAGRWTRRGFKRGTPTSSMHMTQLTLTGIQAARP